MPELKIHLPDELDKRFRKTAMTIFGYGRGAISRAAMEALTRWCSEHDESKAQPQTGTSSKEERTISEHPVDGESKEVIESDKQSEPAPSAEVDSDSSGVSTPA